MPLTPELTQHSFETLVARVSLLEGRLGNLRKARADRVKKAPRAVGNVSAKIAAIESAIASRSRYGSDGPRK